MTVTNHSDCACVSIHDHGEKVAQHHSCMFWKVQGKTTGSHLLLDIRNTLSINAGSNYAERKLSLKREVHMCLLSLVLWYLNMKGKCFRVKLRLLIRPVLHHTDEIISRALMSRLVYTFLGEATSIFHNIIPANHLFGLLTTGNVFEMFSPACV